MLTRKALGILECQNMRPTLLWVNVFELLEVSAMHCYLAVPLSHPYSGLSATLNLPSML